MWRPKSGDSKNRLGTYAWLVICSYAAIQNGAILLKWKKDMIFHPLSSMTNDNIIETQSEHIYT